MRRRLSNASTKIGRYLSGNGKKHIGLYPKSFGQAHDRLIGRWEKVLVLQFGEIAVVHADAFGQLSQCEASIPAYTAQALSEAFFLIHAYLYHVCSYGGPALPRVRQEDLYVARTTRRSLPEKQMTTHTARCISLRLDTPHWKTELQPPGQLVSQCVTVRVTRCVKKSLEALHAGALKRRREWGVGRRLPYEGTAC
jgi:hypothetical protein